MILKTLGIDDILFLKKFLHKCMKKFALSIENILLSIPSVIGCLLTFITNLVVSIWQHTTSSVQELCITFKKCAELCKNLELNSLSLKAQKKL